MSRHKTLQTWWLLLIVLGMVSIISATFGVISWAIDVDGSWETIGVLLFGGPIALLLAAWPVALGRLCAPSRTSATRRASTRRLR